MRGFLINPASKHITEIPLVDAGKVREILGRVECSYPFPGWVCAVEIAGGFEITHSIDDHLCAGRTILYSSDEESGENYSFEQIQEMVVWL